MTFNNPAGNRSTLVRVTGNLFSDIDGIVNTQGANLFLINPNGILFGTNAQLNVGRVFVGSTANGIDLVDGGGRVYTFGTNGNNDAPLLTINPNALLTPSRLIMGGNNGQIVNLGTIETTNQNQYIGLFGGDISIDGGQINAPGGRIEIGGLLAPGTVSWGVEGDNLSAQFPANVTRGDVSLTNAARINVAGSGGGDIAISARNLEILGSTLRGGIEAGFGTPEAVAGDIKINTTGNILISGSGGIGNSVRVDSIGQGGNMTIAAGTFSLTHNAQIQASTGGIGNAGNINLSVTGVADISGTGTAISSAIRSTGEGNGGNITIEAGSVSLRSGATLDSSTAGTGNAGNIGVTSPRITLDGGQLTAQSIFGNGGNISISPANLPILRNGSQISAIAGSANPNLAGQVTTTPPEIDITAGLTPLPNNVTDPTDRINPNCSPKAIANNSFTTVGRGGIPASPKDPLNEEQVTASWVQLPSQVKTTVTSVSPALAPSQQPIVEAQTWQRDRNGDILLVARSASPALRQSEPAAGCIDRQPRASLLSN